MVGCAAGKKFLGFSLVFGPLQILLLPEFFIYGLTTGTGSGRFVKVLFILCANPSDDDYV